MSELEPLLETSASSRTRELLRAGRADAPGAQFSARLLTGLGLGVAAGTVSAMASTGTAAAALPGAASTGSGTASLTVLVGKWVAVGVVGGGILAGGAEVAFSPSNAEPATSAERKLSRAAPLGAAEGTQPAPAQHDAPIAPVAEAEIAPQPDRPSAAEPAQRAMVTPAPGASTAQSSQLRLEVELIDRARRAMAAGDAKLALNELSEFDRLQGTGVLAREAKVLRIEALFRLGQVARARQLAQQYAAAYPNDTHAARLRALDSGKE